VVRLKGREGGKSSVKSVATAGPPLIEVTSIAIRGEAAPIVGIFVPPLMDG
jgi:hypothetical protein